MQGLLMLRRWSGTFRSHGSSLGRLEFCAPFGAVVRIGAVRWLSTMAAAIQNSALVEKL